MNELKDTIALMTSADYKDRFKAEYWQTKIRYDKLEAMVKKYINNELNFIPSCSIWVLKRQLVDMRNYLQTLKKRAKIEGVVLEG